VSKLASEQVKVVLTGEGSDELLAGYQKYWKTLWNVRLGSLYAEALPKYVREKVKDIIDRLVPHPLIKRKLIRTFLYLNPEIESIYFDNFSVFSRQAIGDLLGPKTQEMINDLDPYKVNMYYMNRNGADNLLEKILYTDIKTYLHELLMKQDQMISWTTC
jgi:asparagine synthase (glutamine-hydrolysing)